MWEVAQCKHRLPALEEPLGLEIQLIEFLQYAILYQLSRGREPILL